MKPITHHLTDGQIERLQAESVRTGLPVAELIRRAIDAYLPSTPTCPTCQSRASARSKK